MARLGCVYTICELPLSTSGTLTRASMRTRPRSARTHMNVAIVLLLLGLHGCARRSSTSLAPAASRPIYDGIVTVDPAGRNINAEWTIQLARPGGSGDSVTFLLNQGLQLVEVSGPSVRSHRDTISGGLRRITVRFADGAAHATVRIAYAGTPRFSEDSINGIRPDWVELALDSFWLPIVDDYAQSITGSLRVTVPDGWQVATSGEVARRGSVHTLRQTVPLIDVPWSASPRFTTLDGTRSSILYVSIPDSAARRASQVAESCAAYLDAKYGAPAPLPRLRIVVAPRNGPGYARKNYIVITSLVNMPHRALSRFLCHEVAHFWATGAISSGPDNWINEAFAEFVSNRAVRSIVGASASDSTIAEWRSNAAGQPAIWTGPGGRRPGPRVSYSKAPLLLSRLEERIGTERMDEFLRRFMTEPIRTTPAVVTLLEAVAGREAGAWFAEELGK